jgi:hypothetical protein
VARPGKKQKSGRRAGASPSTSVHVAADRHADDSELSMLQLFRQNLPGLIGLGLSLLQLLGHLSWIGLVLFLDSTGRTSSLDASSPWSWLVVILLGGSLLLTFLAIFVCLFYGLRCPPRSPAIIGFFLSFFIGVLATATVFLQGIRAMAD